MTRRLTPKQRRERRAEIAARGPMSDAVREIWFAELARAEAEMIAADEALTQARVDLAVREAIRDGYINALRAMGFASVEEARAYVDAQKASEAAAGTARRFEPVADPAAPAGRGDGAGERRGAGPLASRRSLSNK